MVQDSTHPFDASGLAHDSPEFWFQRIVKAEKRSQALKQPKDLLVALKLWAFIF